MNVNLTMYYSVPTIYTTACWLSVITPHVYILHTFFISLCLILFYV